MMMGKKKAFAAFGAAGLLSVAVVASALWGTGGAKAAGTGSGASNIDAALQEKLDRLLGAGIIQGDSKGDLGLDQNLTRASFAAIIARAFQLDVSTTSISTFSDVKTGAWYTGYINAIGKLATENGFTLGTGNGAFNPNGNLSTAETLAFVMKFVGMKPDAEASGGWANQYIAAAVSQGLILSSDQSSYSAKELAERGFIFGLLDHTFESVPLPSGHTVYEGLEVGGVGSGVYKKDGAGTAP